jgi:hypothetical protein
VIKWEQLPMEGKGGFYDEFERLIAERAWAVKAANEVQEQTIPEHDPEATRRMREAPALWGMRDGRRFREPQ